MTISPRARAGGGSAKKGAKKAAAGGGGGIATKAAKAAAAADAANAMADGDAAPTTPAVWRPGYDPLEEDETLQYDPTAYDCMHSLALEWPCLSFDVLRDAATAARVAASSAASSSAASAARHSTTAAAAAAVASFPHTLFLAAGTQAATRSANSLSLLRLGRVGRGRHGPAALRDGDDDDGLSTDSDDDEGDRPTLAARRVAVGAGVNRVRAMPQHPGIVAAWLDSGVVSIWDLRQQLGELEGMTDAESARDEDREKRRAAAAGGKRRAAAGGDFLSLAPVASHRHGAEGFGLAWSPGPAPGRLASGDCGGGLRVWEPREGGGGSGTPSGASSSLSASPATSALSWAVSQPYGGHDDHRASVEDVAWSPTEGTVFATAATDAALRVYDARARSRPQLVIRSAHASDVNVVSWSALATFMLASGGDDGAVKAWDLRAVGSGGSGGKSGGGGGGEAATKKTAAAAAPAGEVARLCYHRGAVTSVEWSPTESSVLLSTGDASDGTTCVWDLAVERDPEEEAALGAGAAVAAAGGAEAALPAQLLFVHAGQADVKEAHWHPQIDGLVASTAADGFNVWRAANV
jgi:ribosome assembly protein RRB1